VRRQFAHAPAPAVRRRSGTFRKVERARSTRILALVTLKLG
jgi:hypothetical protein